MRCTVNYLGLKQSLGTTIALATGLAVPVVFGIIATPAIHGQSGTTTTPRFDAASIKLCKDGDGPGRSGGGPPARSPGRLHIACAPMLGFIANAYTSSDAAAQRPGRGLAIEGAPAWLNSDRYAIDAEADGVPGEQMMRGPMLWALFEDRFKLRAHRETREIPVYTLTVAKAGPKFHPSQEGSCIQHVLGEPLPDTGGKPLCGLGGMRTARNGPNLKLDVPGASFLNFSTFLSIILDRPMIDKTGIDKTGIAGTFDFHLEFAPDETTPGPIPGKDDNRNGPAASDPIGGTSIFTALQEQLGLKLEAAKGPGDFLVIDHIERPSEN